MLGVDDAQFEKRQAGPVPIVSVMMEGAVLVEGVAISSFPVDGDAATEFLSTWIGGLRWHATLQAVVLGGITIAGLGIVDLTALSGRLGVPVISVTRHDTQRSELETALRAAGLVERVSILARAPPARQIRDGLYVACAGADPEAAERLASSTLHKARGPEPLRIAHLIGAALVRGESKGRV